MTETILNLVTSDPYCAAARSIDQLTRREGVGGLIAGAAVVPVAVVSVGAGVLAGGASGPFAPAVGTAAGVGTFAVLSGAIYAAHDAIQNRIDSYQNRVPATPPPGMTCKEHLSVNLIMGLRYITSDLDNHYYQGSSLQKLLYSHPEVMTQILETPARSDPFRKDISLEEIRVREFAITNAPKLKPN